MREYVESDPIVQRLSTLQEPDKESMECENLKVVNVEMDLGHW
jgi:hypothetical protein